MSEYLFTEDGMEDYLYWQTQDRKTLKKVNSLLKSISRDPFKGEGKPEPLKNENGMWSRDWFTDTMIVKSQSINAKTIMMISEYDNEKQRINAIPLDC